MDRTEFATKAVMPHERRSKIDTAIITVTACTAGDSLSTQAMILSLRWQ
jgi:hypothetical protein